GQAREIRERNRRRPIVDRLLRRPLDASLRRNVQPIRKIGILRRAIAVERQMRGVDAVRAEVVSPAQVRIVAKAVARIEKSEQLRALALPPLETIVQRQPVVL